ncbi:MAG TPA: SDR family NAD(P)-dependent oxidoreductase [Acidimicrobiia bacterium]
MSRPLIAITGANAGIGRETAIELGRRGFDLVLFGRSEARTAPLLGELAALGAGARFVACDLASLVSVAEAARHVSDPVDVLINNAGVGGRRGVTADGFELAFGVNHLGHHLLTRLLLPRIRRRVVTVSSNAHFGAPGIDWGRVRAKTRSLTGWSEYQASKLANVLFSRELSRRAGGDDTTYCVHPGMVSTGMWRLPPPLRGLVIRNLVPVDQGAKTSVWCATDPDLAGATGAYYVRCRPGRTSEVAADDDLALELWDRSEAWLAPYLA